MRCKEVNKLMDDYLKGTLDNKTQLEVDEHFKTCTQCENNLLLLKSLKQLASEEISVYSDNPYFARNVMHRIEQQRKSPGTDIRIRSLTYAAIAAAVIIGLFIGNLLGTFGSNLIISSESDAKLIAEDYIPSNSETIYEFNIDELENQNK